MSQKYKVGQYVELVNEVGKFSEGEIVKIARIDKFVYPYLIVDKYGGIMHWVSESDFTRSSKWAEGEIIVNKDGGKHKILGESGEVLHISLKNNFEGGIGATSTQYMLERAGYTRLEDEEVVEITKAEVLKIVGDLIGKTFKVVK